MRLLLVEDEAPLRLGLARQLEADGYRVDQAADGEDGLFQAREYPVDLAIVDLGLPKLGGLNVVKALRADGRAIPLLEHLVRERARIVTKQELSDYLYPHDEDRDSNVVEVLIGRLRRKLDPGGTLAPIETLRGRGYRFTLA